jgi:hypothetical protein
LRRISPEFISFIRLYLLNPSKPQSIGAARRTDRGISMIISHKHRYLFVELPHTGTTAISKELRLHYDGESILYRHATYDEFLQQATPAEKAYFVFSNIRNPLDDAVSCYFKYKNEVKGFIGFDVNSKASLSNPRDLARRFVYHFRYDRYRFVHEQKADFPAFFLRYYWLPYDSWSSLSHHKFNFLIHFENLQEDFAKALELLNITPVRPLPTVHKTSGRSQNFTDYYTPETYARAVHVFGPYMKKWGYKFPAEWGDRSVSWADHLAFETLGAVKRFAWRYARPAVYSLVVKKKRLTKAVPQQAAK